MRRIWTANLLVILMLLIGVAFYLFGQNKGREKAITTEADITPTSVIVAPSIAPTIFASPSAQSSPPAVLTQ